jgi:hypothetical protein
MSEHNLETLLSRHAAFWERAPADGPLLHVARSDEETRYDLRGLDLPLADGTVLSAQDEPLTPELIDPSLILDVLEFPTRQQSSGSGGPETVGDLLVTRAPLGKMAWMEAILGCPIIPKLDTGSIYSAPYLDGPEKLSKIPSLEQSPWLRLLKEYTSLLVEDSDERYQVVQCLQRGPVDMVSAMLGHSEMCFAIYDSPVELQALTEICTETFIAVARAQQAIIPQLSGGRCTPFAVWAPGTVVRTQCDVTSSMSAGMYEKFFFPYDVEICKEFDYSVVHLHSGYLHTVEVFLKDRFPTAVQISLDTGSTPHGVADLMPVFSRILEEKPLFIQGRMTASELQGLIDGLPHRGLYISTATLDDE